jgi:sucrose-6F-phosphate phosphohydrolase
MTLSYLLVCDLDDTLTGDKKGIYKFNQIASSDKFCLAYSSGRFKSSMMSLIVKVGLVYPDVLIANLGTEIYYAPDWNKDKEWNKQITEKWNKQTVLSHLDDMDIECQPYHKEFVIPYYADNEVVDKVKEKIKHCDSKVVLTKNRFLDILPESAGKGNAAIYIGAKMGLPVICCGDSKNDEEMLKKSDYGILVGNAPDNLRIELSKYSHVYLAKSFHAYGVIEGLTHHGIITP